MKVVTNCKMNNHGEVRLVPYKDKISLSSSMHHKKVYIVSQWIKTLNSIQEPIKIDMNKYDEVF